MGAALSWDANGGEKPPGRDACGAIICAQGPVFSRKLGAGLTAAIELVIEELDTGTAGGDRAKWAAGGPVGDILGALGSGTQVWPSACPVCCTPVGLGGWPKGLGGWRGATVGAAPEGAPGCGAGAGGRAGGG